MKKALVLVSVLAVVAAASASVQIFYTADATGLTNPAMAFLPTEGNHTDITDGHYAVGTFPAGMANATADPGQTVYVWFKFNAEPASRKVNGLDLDASAGAPTNAAWYILDDTGGDTADKRWDGAYGAGAPEFKTAHKVLVAATAYGLKNLSGANAGWLYSGNPSRTYLLGALTFADPNVVGGADYTLALGTAGINYSGGYSAPTVEFGTIHVNSNIPEPASLALLGLAGLLIRRR